MNEFRLSNARHFLRTVITGLFLGACVMGAAKTGDRATWKEQVLLHDGSQIVLQRSQTRGGRHEIGQEVPIAEHAVSFSHPKTNRVITWKSEYGMELAKSSLVLLALDIVRGEPYIVTHPARCIAYNKWNRPNPPYVFFRFDGTAWQQIDLAALPPEIKGANVVVATQQYERRLTSVEGVLSTEEVNRLNAEERNEDLEYLRVFVRHPIKTAQTTTCPKMVYDGKGGWRSVGGPKAPNPITPPASTGDYK